jgi:hypothetical protein
VAINVPVPSPLEVKRVVANPVVAIGDTVIVTTTVKNIGPYVLHNVILTDTAGICDDIFAGDLDAGEEAGPYLCSLTVTEDMANITHAEATIAGGGQTSNRAILYLYAPDGTVGSGTAGSCNETALDAEIYVYTGENVGFDCGGAPHVIPITQTKVITATHNKTFDGDGLITISGQHQVRVFHVAKFTTLQLQDLNIAYGAAHRPTPSAATEGGGGIRNLGTVIIHGGALYGNSADTGGAIHNRGTLAIYTASLYANKADIDNDNDSDGVGGAIFNGSGGVLTIKDSQLTGNSAYGGGGLINYNGGAAGTPSADIANTLFSDNRATNGGGIQNEKGVVTLTSSWLDNNWATSLGGGIYMTATGSVTISHTVLSNNQAHYPNEPAYLTYGGGIYIYGAGDPDTNVLLITDSSLTGNQAGYGGGILNTGTLTANHTNFMENAATFDGGAIFNAVVGLVTVSNCTFDSNTAMGGGGILNWGHGELTILDSTLVNNQANNGGAIENGVFGEVWVRGSQILANRAVFHGGGIANYDNGIVFISNGSELTGNHADRGGGISNGITEGDGGHVYIVKSELSHNTAVYGGAVINDHNGFVGIQVNPDGRDAPGRSFLRGNSAAADGGAVVNWGDGGVMRIHNTGLAHNTAIGGGAILNWGKGVLTVNRSSLIGNMATNGGAVENGDEGTLTIVNSTLANNVAEAIGGAVVQFGPTGMVAINNSTIALNWSPTGGMVHNVDTGTITLAQSVVAGAPASDDCFGPISSGGFNLVNDGSCGLSGTGDLNSTDPLLGPLAADGDYQVQSLLPGSPAIDRIPHVICAVRTDQWGTVRPVDGDGDTVAACDTGAYEYVPAGP